MANEAQADQIELNFEPIRGYPELRWAGKRPFRSTYYYPAQLRERHGEPGEEGWRNKLYWGDNLQVMAHLVREYRGQVKLIYIDPPYDSKADYKKRIELRGQEVENDRTAFEEKQYADIWNNDDYLQFMYERLTLLRELLHEDGSLYLHADFHRVHHLRSIADEVFGPGCFQREIIWRIGWISGYKSAAPNWIRNHDTILYYTKQPSGFTFNKEYLPYPEGYVRRDGNAPTGKGYPIEDTWNCSEMDRLDSIQIMSFSGEKVGYPTQKNENLLRRVIQASSNPGDLVFDAFMGSGTTQAVAMKLGRRFLGCDINLGAIHTTVKRLNDVAGEMSRPKPTQLDAAAPIETFTAFDVYTVNHYDVFRNEVEAKPLLMEALAITPTAYPPWEGTKFDADGHNRMVKVMPINRIATRADLNDIVAGVDVRRWDAKAKAAPNEPVERITLICMGHEPDLRAHLEAELRKLCNAKYDIEVVDVLRSGANLQFKRESEAQVSVASGKLTVDAFFPMNLLQKLSLDAQHVADWKELVDSVMIDWNYDGAVFTPTEVDVPEGRAAKVKGVYNVPKDHGEIRIKITDVLSESWEATVWGAA